MAESDERIAKLLDKLKSNDSEAKVDAITKLRAEFEAGVQPTEVEEVIAALKITLRIPNQHIYTATLATIASLFPVLTSHSSNVHTTYTQHDITVIRHALIAFLAPGGIVDRLGDNREKPRDTAREALVSAGVVASKCSPPIPAHATKSAPPQKGPETPLAIFERSLRELGFGSKVGRVREQTILTLTQLRRVNPHFPLRPFVPHLVDTLEDSDGGVRDCARASVIEMFTASTVSDGARADLKKEMTKKAVRKGIVDSIQNALLSSGSTIVADAPEEGSSSHAEGLRPTGLGSRKTTATSLASSSGATRTISVTSSGMNDMPVTPVSEVGETVVAPVYIASARDLEHEFTSMIPPFEGRESEHNWQQRDRAVTRVRGMLKGDVHLKYPEVFIEGLKGGYMTNTLKTLTSLRTVVSTNTCALYVELVHALGPAYEPFIELTITQLFRMGALTKKIVASETQNTAKEILIHANCHPRTVLPMLWQGVQDKNISVRQYSLAHIKTILETNAVRAKALIEATGGVEILEKCIKRALSDQNIGIRETARGTFWIFDGVWHDKAEALANTLDAMSRKQLEKAAPSGTPAIAAAAPSAESKKSSVAAAIAASRAKAKQIAAAPPTLRHAATAHASTAASQQRRPASPGSPPSMRTAPVTSPMANSKRASGAFQRSVTSPPIRTTISRSPTGATTKSATSGSPPASPTQSPSHRPSPLSGTRGASGSAVTSPTSSRIPLRSPPSSHAPLPSSLSARSASPPVHTAQVKRASGIFSSPPQRFNLSPQPSKAINDTLTLSPHPSDDESLMRLRAPSSSAGSSESLPMASFSDAYTSTPPGRLAETALLTRSTNPVKMPGPVVEDALRARAEQAESAAERLLEELVETDDTIQNIHLPPQLVLSASKELQMNGGATPRAAKSNGSSIFTASSTSNVKVPPKTPVNNRASFLKQSAAFQDSPAYKPGSHSLVDKLKDNRNETSWWLKRVALLQQAGPSPSNEASVSDELKKDILALENDTAGVLELKRLAVVCSRNPAVEQEESSLGLGPGLSDVWDKGLLTYRLLSGLWKILTPEKNEEVLEYGLVVLWEMLENQQLYLEGRESELIALLFRLRYTNSQTVAEATNTIRDALTARIDPVYGLTTVYGSLKKFLADPIPSYGSADTRALSHAFGLLAIGKSILRLPPEILEEELPRLQLTLVQGLNDSQLLVREAAAAAIIAAQLVLRDETYLFTMLASLSEEKKNLLTYLFDKHGARGHVEGVTAGNQGGLDRLEKEMSRLDRRMSTPARRQTLS